MLFVEFNKQEFMRMMFREHNAELGQQSNANNFPIFPSQASTTDSLTEQTEHVNPV